MLGRFARVLALVSLVMLIAGVFGSVILKSMMSPGVINLAVRVDYFLNEYDWLLRLWRYSMYAILFQFWPSIGRKARVRDSRDWTEDDVRDWNGYRYRLVVILLAVDIAIIDQQLFRLFELTS